MTEFSFGIPKTRQCTSSLLYHGKPELKISLANTNLLASLLLTVFTMLKSVSSTVKTDFIIITKSSAANSHKTKRFSEPLAAGKGERTWA